MGMENLPRPGFSVIDIRDAMLDGDLLPSRLSLRVLDTQFVGHITLAELKGACQLIPNQSVLIQA